MDGPDQGTNQIRITMHEIIIILVIIAIVGFQVKIFLDAKTRISFFKEIIPGGDNFETVKVYIPESQIKEIKIDYVLGNLHKFQLPGGEPEAIEIEVEVMKEIMESPEADFNEPIQAEVEGEIMEEEAIDYESLIWVSKGNEEKKIKLKFLKSNEMLGWNRIQ